MAGRKQTSSPPHTAELGTLKALPNRESSFTGSASGVFFVNTVRRAFSAALNASELEDAAFSKAEDSLVGNGGRHERVADGKGVDRFALRLSGEELSPSNMIGKPPNQTTTTELIMSYFKSWHPLFPFIHGPSFARDVESLYTEGGSPHTKTDGRLLVTFQCVVNIASLDYPSLSFPERSRIRSATDLLHFCGLLFSRHDIASLQALLAAQLYLIATMSLREASAIGGMIMKSVFHAGLHRCPFRYEQLSQDDREMRKRILWAAYVLDRYLTQALGLPLGYQDSDIDVCLPGLPELHESVGSKSDFPVSRRASDEVTLHLPAAHRSTERPRLEEANAGSGRPKDDLPLNDAKSRREAALANLVRHGRLTGRILELFHKSIHVRSAERDSILRLTSDVEAWWNDLPAFLQDDPSGELASQDGLLGPFFTILYQQLLLLINRPSLSLDSSSPEFQHGLQVCIRASRTTISALRAQKHHSKTLFWPGFLSAAWMSGLIIAFACHLGQYLISKGTIELTACIDLLQAMASRWNSAKQCQAVLTSLLAGINRKKRPSPASMQPTVKRTKNPHQNETPSSLYPHSHPDSWTAANNQSAAQPAQHDHFVQDAAQIASCLPMQSPVAEPFQIATNPDSLSAISAISKNGSAPELPNPATADHGPGDLDNSMWNDLDFSGGDIFGGATWENLMGSADWACLG